MPAAFSQKFWSFMLSSENCIIFQLRKHDREHVKWVFYKLGVSPLNPYVSEKISREGFLPAMQTRCFVTIYVPLTRCLLLNCAVRCHTNKSPKMKATWNFYACCVICVGFMTSEKTIYRI
jgi:hypothetical protein